MKAIEKGTIATLTLKDVIELEDLMNVLKEIAKTEDIKKSAEEWSKKFNDIINEFMYI